jgi:hypothetical protein
MIAFIVSNLAVLHHSTVFMVWLGDRVSPWPYAGEQVKRVSYTRMCELGQPSPGYSSRAEEYMQLAQDSGCFCEC